MTYEEALEYIHSMRHGGPDLTRMRRILKEFGSPEADLRFVHVAGTNGKGSVSAQIGNILVKSGYKTGLFTSPFVTRFNERIRVNNMDISDEALAETAGEVRDVLEKLGESPAEFELVTILGLVYFAKVKCDIVVLEVGMGGARDATNVIPRSEVSVITALGLDHTQYLGGTLEEIAGVKAGIVKEGGRCVVSRDVGGVIEGVCRERGAEFVQVDRSALRVRSRGLWGAEFDFQGLERLRVPLAGAFQPENAAEAVTAAGVLASLGWRITEESIRAGLETVSWPGRLEHVRGRPDAFLDGGHNPQAVRAAVESLREYFPDKRIIFVLGVMADKDVGGIIDALEPVAERVFCVEPPAPRAMRAGELAGILRSRGIEAQAAPSIEEGAGMALRAAGEDGVICALGSLYILENAGRALRFS